MARETEAKHDIYPILKHGTKLLAKYLKIVGLARPRTNRALKNVMLYTSGKNKTCGISYVHWYHKKSNSICEIFYLLSISEVDQKSTLTF